MFQNMIMHYNNNVFEGVKTSYLSPTEYNLQQSPTPIISTFSLANLYKMYNYAQQKHLSNILLHF